MRAESRRRVVAGLLMFGAGFASADPPPPEIASAFTPRPTAGGRHFMAVTANPHATVAAVAVLRDGGSAVDAAIAAQMVLGVVEPQSSGIGGGGLMLHFDARRQRLDAWDGRETAPRAAVDGPFRNAVGAPLAFRDAVRDPRAVGAPGLVAMLALAHRSAGRLPWARLFAPAIHLAEAGFPVSPRLHALLAWEGGFADPAAQALFFDAAGQPWPVGHALRNPALADSLRRIAAQGPEALRRGVLADAMIDALRAGLPADQAEALGLLGHGDLLAYAPQRRAALCRPFRGYRVCGFPPPSSGATTVLAMLGIWHALPGRGAPDSAGFVHRFAEVGRLAYADRAACVGDPAFHAVPVAALLDPRYLARRAALVGEGAGPRRTSGLDCAAEADEAERPSTSHLSIVDGAGNAVALTSSIEDAFGNRRMAGGFLLNNQLTDFSTGGVNRIAPGKRPRSAMAPTLVFDRRGALYAVLGSPGGSQIPNFVAQALLGLIEGGMTPAEIVAQPRFGNRNGATEVERGRLPPASVAALQARGHLVRQVDMTSGVALVVRGGGRWIGAADPRREGQAAGE